MKTESEYLFVIVNDRIGMVRKDSDGFTAVPCSDDGNFMVSFSDQDSYWKQWASQTNFTARRNTIDFAFVTDSEDCQFCSEKLKQSDFKRVEQTVWSLRVVEEALRSAQEKFNLKGISLFENGKCVKTLRSGGAESLQTLYLTRHGNVEEEIEVPRDGRPEQDSKEPVSNVRVKNESKDVEEKVPVAADCVLVADCLGNDEKAMALKVDDVISCVFTRISRLRNKCFADSNDLSAQLKMRYSDLSSYCESFKRPLPQEGDKVGLKVLSVNVTPPFRIDLNVEIVG